MKWLHNTCIYNNKTSLPVICFIKLRFNVGKLTCKEKFKLVQFAKYCITYYFIIMKVKIKYSENAMTYVYKFASCNDAPEEEKLIVCLRQV